MPPTTTTACAVCTSRSRYAPAVTTEGGQAVCYFHASQDWRDAVELEEASAAALDALERRATVRPPGPTSAVTIQL